MTSHLRHVAIAPPCCPLKQPQRTFTPSITSSQGPATESSLDSRVHQCFTGELRLSTSHIRLSLRDARSSLGRNLSMKTKSLFLPSSFTPGLNRATIKATASCCESIRRIPRRRASAYAQVFDQALCYGRIDGQKLPRDAKSWLQKFTPKAAREWLVEAQHGARKVPDRLRTG
jgi:hypothetical protein